jgi:branched-subunit amino acid aminotransferase/4-amino-4-deoxychorismate lyase
MVVLNGSFVEERHAMLPVFDRGFLYGDAVFETAQ